jgi:hypothetical protein
VISIPNVVMTSLGNVVGLGVLPVIDRAAAASRVPFAQPHIIRPLNDSRRYGWTHYGVFFPLLPEPHRYLNVMTFLGQTGTLCFDNDYIVEGDPRQTATLLTSTAAPDVHLYRAYDMRADCELAPDGSVVRFGEDLSITGSWPEFDVSVRNGDFSFDATVMATKTVSYFVKNPIYDHLSLLAGYEATMTFKGETTSVEGLCTFEFARCVSPHSLVHRPVPEGWKLPVDFFTYQVVNLDESTQLLLTDVRVNGHSIAKTMHVRTTDGRAEVYDDVVFEVSEGEPEPRVAPDFGRMSLPRRVHWRVRHHGREILSLEGEIDCPWRHGHGQGYVSAYRFTGYYRGEAVSGRGYIEYVDCEGR